MAATTAAPVLIAAVCTQIAASAVMVANSSPEISVFEDARLLGLCTIGSLGGALLAIALFPPAHDSDAKVIRRLAMKFGCSLVGGLLFTPGIMEWFNIQFSANRIVASAAAISLVVVSTIHQLVPIWEAWLRTRAKRKIKTASTDE